MRFTMVHVFRPRAWLMAGFLLSVLMAGCGGRDTAKEAPAARSVRLYEVGSNDAKKVRVYPGRVAPSTELEMTFRVGGPLIALEVAEGDRVEEGAVLAAIDPRDYENRLKNVTSALETARAELKAMQAGARSEDIRQLEATVSAASADAKKARMDYERADRLLKEGAVAQTLLDTARKNHDLARANLEAAQAALDSGRTGARSEDVEGMEARIRGLEAQEEEASNALSDTKLVAPFTGVVARRYVENFQSVSAGQAILNLQSQGSIDVVVNVPERDVARAPKSPEETDISHVRVTFDAFPGREFPVTLKEFKTEADPNTQTYEVTLNVAPSDDMNVAPGMTASVRAERGLTTIDAGTLVVPVEAVFQAEDGSSCVWIIDPGSMAARRRAVEAGAPVADGIEILRGLESGEVVAATGVHHIREGMKVRPMEPPVSGP